MLSTGSLALQIPHEKMWYVLFGSPASNSTIVWGLCAVVLGLSLPQAWASEFPVLSCPFTSTPDPEQQERFLDTLKGKKLLFIGDSVTRFVPLT